MCDVCNHETLTPRLHVSGSRVVGKRAAKAVRVGVVQFDRRLPGRASQGAFFRIAHTKRGAIFIGAMSNKAMAATDKEAAQFPNTAALWYEAVGAALAVVCCQLTACCAAGQVLLPHWPHSHGFRLRARSSRFGVHEWGHRRRHGFRRTQGRRCHGADPPVLGEWHPAGAWPNWLERRSSLIHGCSRIVRTGRGSVGYKGRQRRSWAPSRASHCTCG